MSARTVVTSSRSKYLDTLEAAWAQHLASRAPDAPTVISTFAGAGGSSLGYSMAGFHELLAVEWDDNAVATFGLNFPGVPVYHGDIAKLSVDEVLQRTGLQPGQLDVFDGSPPCQGFSTAGKRIIDDPRNQLFREYVRLLRGLRPKVFVMENVSGMVKGKMKLVFAEILTELKASGYRVSARLLNAMYFHVPQSRERMIFIGVRDDLGREPSHPRAQSRPTTVREAISGAPEYMMPFLPSVGSKAHTWRASLKQGQSPSDMGSKSDFQTVRLRLDCSAPTLVKDCKLAGYSPMIHPTEPRSITIGEMRRMASFPDDFIFAGKYFDAHSRIGNSVPPLFMRAIAQHIRDNLL